MDKELEILAVIGFTGIYDFFLFFHFSRCIMDSKKLIIIIT